MANKSVVKQVSFPQQLLKLAETRTNQLGVTIPEYVRYLVMTDTVDLVKNLPLLDEETEASVARGLEDVESGKLTEFVTDKDIAKYVQGLATDNE